MVAVHRDTAKWNGKRLDVLTCTVFDIRNGKAMDRRSGSGGGILEAVVEVAAQAGIDIEW